jgi:hypothetical protein
MNQQSMPDPVAMARQTRSGGAASSTDVQVSNSLIIVVLALTS